MAEVKLACPVCSNDLSIKMAHGRKSGKPFLMFICPVDGRHIRAFITDQNYISSVLTRLESKNR